MRDGLLNLIKREIDCVENDQNTLAIILVGSGVDIQNISFLPRDIDIFVIQKEGKILEREVIKKNQINWDITYLSLKLLKEGIKEKWPFLIQSLQKNKPLYVLDEEIYSLLINISDIYKEGPGPLNQEEILYLRFTLTQDYEDLIQISLKSPESSFLAQNILKKTLIIYFKLNNLWIPKDKKVLAILKDREADLFDLAEKILLEENTNKALVILEDMIKYVLNPFGGKLKYWPKGKFPLK